MSRRARAAAAAVCEARAASRHCCSSRKTPSSRRDGTAMEELLACKPALSAGSCPARQRAWTGASSRRAWQLKRGAGLACTFGRRGSQRTRTACNTLPQSQLDSAPPWGTPCAAARRLLQHGPAQCQAESSALAVGLLETQRFVVSGRRDKARTSLQRDAALHSSAGGCSSRGELLEGVAQSSWRLWQVGVHKGDAAEQGARGHSDESLSQPTEAALCQLGTAKELW